MNRIDKLWKSSLTWTTVMLIFLVIGVTSGALGLMNTFNYASQLEKVKGTEVEAYMIAMTPTLVDKVIAVFTLLLQIVITILVFISRGKIKDRIFPDMTGYFLNLGLFVFNIIFTIIKLGKLASNPIVMAGIIGGLMFVVLGIIPTILVIIRQNTLHNLGAVEGFNNENQ